MILIENLQKSFNINNGLIILFQGLTFEVIEGQFLTILGPNGCGKSTLLNLITGIDKLYTGQIKVKGQLDKISTNVAYMLQKDLLLPWLTVKENIYLGVKIQGKFNSQTDKKIDTYLDSLNILKLKNHYPSKLSGGEKQKVALIRTLVLDTPILLLDEPFSAIDYNTRLELQKTIFTYAESNNTTVILISHDIDEAIAVSDRILIFDHKPRGIRLDIKVELQIRDRNPVTARQDPEFSRYYNTIWQNYPR